MMDNGMTLKGERKEIKDADNKKIKRLHNETT